MMAASTAAPAVMPTEDQFNRAKDALEEAVKRLLDVRGSIDRFAEDKDARPPTFDDVGRVYAFRFDARSYVDEITEAVASLDGALEELDYVRVTESGTVNQAHELAARRKNDDA
jgi:DNA repair ATPase RecN